MIIVFLVITLLVMLYYVLSNKGESLVETELSLVDSIKNSKVVYWTANDIYKIKNKDSMRLAEYGRELIAHTSLYLGPNGIVSQSTNGMNCQNCHLDAGKKTFGNNYGSVYSLYPKHRDRSGTVEDIYKRINDCIERSLNGKGLAIDSREMQAFSIYINSIGSNVKKGEKAKGSGLKDLAFLDRACDLTKGKKVYVEKCESCHQADGQGLMKPTNDEYTYPPLWGPYSYNDGAGLYRVSNFAKYVKYNMPLGVTHEAPQLTDEEAWDIAAFVNSQPRPHKEVPYDWPKIDKKPIDHPFGPYADGFSEKQHKYGPFKPIKQFKALNKSSK
jgi:thiosulfate dehydrogenase